MRTISTREAMCLRSPNRVIRVRALLTWNGQQVDLTDLAGRPGVPGFSALLSVSWGESVDEPLGTATLTLDRNIEELSLAPFMTGSRLNRKDSTASFAYEPLLALNRVVEIQTQVLSSELEGRSGTWRREFQGYIDEVDPGEGTITLQCRNLAALLQDTTIERERVYAFAQGASATKGVYVWQPSTAYALGDYLCPTDAKGAVQKFYECTFAGTTGTSEPAWPAAGSISSGTATFSVVGDTSGTAGTALETVVQQLLNDNLGAGTVTLQLGPQGPSNWALRYFLQKREPLLEAVRALTLQRGWDVRYLYDDGTSSFRFTLYEPERTKTVPDYTLPAGWLLKSAPVRQSIAGIRNAFRGYYSDSLDKDASGVARRKYLDVEDAASIAKYGRRYMEMAEKGTSFIDSTVEMQRLLDAAASDLSEPLAERTAPIPFFPWVQLGDLYRFSPDGVLHDEALDLAVVGYRHNLSPGDYTTTLTCRGKPAGAYRMWHALSAYPGVSENGQDTQRNTDAGVALSATGIINGGRLSITTTQAKSSVLTGYEWHVSTSPSFTPDSTTLKGKGSELSFDASSLPPGTAHYAKVVPYGTSAGVLVKGEPTAEVAFTTRYVEPRTLQQRISYGALPLNGDFEANNTADAPPDGWVMATGTWGVDTSLTTDAATGSYAVTIAAGSNPEFVSQLMVVRPSTSYTTQIIAKRTGTAASMILSMQFFSDAGLTLVGSSSNTSSPSSAYSIITLTGTSPSTARYARIRLGSATTGGPLYIDSVEMFRTSLPQRPWQLVGSGSDPTYDISFSSGWTNYDVSLWEQVGFRINSLGDVQLKGLARASNPAPVPGAIVFTLPAGYRPAMSRAWIVNASTGQVDINVGADGSVTVGAVGASAYLSFESIVFEAA